MKTTPNYLNPNYKGPLVTPANMAKDFEFAGEYLRVFKAYIQDVLTPKRLDEVNLQRAEAILTALDKVASQVAEAKSDALAGVDPKSASLNAETTRSCSSETPEDLLEMLLGIDRRITEDKAKDAQKRRRKSQATAA